MSFEHHPRRGAAWEPDAPDTDGPVGDAGPGPSVRVRSEGSAVRTLSDGSATRELIAGAAAPEPGECGEPGERGKPDEPGDPAAARGALGAGAEWIGGWELMQRGWAIGEREPLDPVRALGAVLRRVAALAARLWRRLLRRAPRALPASTMSTAEREAGAESATRGARGGR